MHILIAGAGGYIGSEMVKIFLQKKYKVIALDRYFFGDTLHDFKKDKNLTIIKDDIRYCDETILKNVKAIINLASISNDPSAELDPQITQSINYDGAVKLAKLAKKCHVEKYIFSSSCSVYGASNGIVDEQSTTNPISEYAKSKVEAEKKLLQLADNTFAVTVLRLATVYGLSKRRMRFDLIVNIMTLHAWKNKKIFVMGGGKQWRPIVHLKDCIRAFLLIMNEKNKRKINKQIFNVGSNKQNYQVFQIANYIKKYFPEISIEETPDDRDLRSYRVNFDKINKELSFSTNKTLDEGISEIREGLESGEIIEDIRTNTFSYYQYLLEANTLLSSIKIRNKLF